MPILGAFPRARLRRTGDMVYMVRQWAKRIVLPYKPYTARAGASSDWGSDQAHSDNPDLQNDTSLL